MGYPAAVSLAVDVEQGRWTAGARHGLDLDQGPGRFEEPFRSTTTYNWPVCRYLAKSLSMLSMQRAGPQARVIDRPVYEPARVPFLYDTMHHAGQRQIASCRLWESS